MATPDSPDTKHIHRAICYIRKSREDEQAERRGEDTLAKQRDMLLHDVLCRYTFTYDIAEEVASGDSIRERPVFQELLRHLGSKYQAIVCKDLSRLGRGSYSDMGIVYDMIRDRRIFIITKDTIYDPHNFSDLRMIRFSLFFNREEYEMTLWRLTEGKYDGAERGKWVAGSVPFGFVYDRHSQILKPLPEQAQVVRSMFDWYVNEKLGYQAIANRLMSLSIPTPRGKSKWYSEVVRRILKNPAYHGTLAFRLTKRNKLDGKIVKRPSDEQIIVEHAFDPLIDESTWQKAVARGTGQKDVPFTESRSNHYELAGIVICETCKHKLVRQASKKSYRKKNGSVSNYKKEFLYCKACGYAVQYRECERQITEVLSHLPLPNKEQIIKKYQTMIFANDKKQDPQFDQAKSYQKQLEIRKKNFERRLAKARDMLLDGVFSKHDYINACKQYEQELNQITDLLMQNNKQTVPSKTTVGVYRENGTNPPKFDEFHSLANVYQCLRTPNLKNQLLHVLIERTELRVHLKCEGRKRGFSLAMWMNPEWDLIFI